MSESAPAIVARGLAKSYGDVIALDGIDLEAREGTVLGLLGPNGAGKTTAVRILTTLLQPDTGTPASPASMSSRGAAAALAHRAGRARTPRWTEPHRLREPRDGRSPLPPRQGRVADPADELLERFELDEAADRAAKTYSGGMRRRLDLAAALVARPPVLFLDEPTTGLDPRSRRGMWDDDRGPRRPRRDRAADHPVPGGGRPPRRPHRRDRPRPRDRRGHAGRAEGPSRRRAARGHAGARGGRRARRRGPRPARRRRPPDRRGRAGVGRGAAPRRCDRRCRAQPRRRRDRRRGPRASPPDARRRVPVAHGQARRGGAAPATRRPRRHEFARLRGLRRAGADQAQPAADPATARPADRLHDPARDVHRAVRLRVRRSDPHAGLRLRRLPDARDHHPDRSRSAAS